MLLIIEGNERMYLQEKSVIANKVHQENELRKVLNRIVPQVISELEAFIGQKIIKADGSLVKKFTDKIAYLQDMRDKIKIKPLQGMKHASLQCLYVTCSPYSIRLEISASFQVSDHGCTYAKQTVYIGDIKNSLMGAVDNGTLEKVYEFELFPTLSAAQQWTKYEKACKAKEKAEAAKTTLWYGLRDLV